MEITTSDGKKQLISHFERMIEEQSTNLPGVIVRVSVEQDWGNNTLFPVTHQGIGAFGTFEMTQYFTPLVDYEKIISHTGIPNLANALELQLEHEIILYCTDKKGELMGEPLASGEIETGRKIIVDAKQYIDRIGKLVAQGASVPEEWYTEHGRA